jgi:hypothetical protein
MAHRQGSSPASRRAFITLLGGAAAAWPRAARAQQPTMPVVGYLGPGTEVVSRHYLAAINGGLAEASYILDRNLAIETRWAEDRYDRLPALADELVRRQVSVIVPLNSAASFAAKRQARAVRTQRGDCEEKELKARTERLRRGGWRPLRQGPVPTANSPVIVRVDDLAGV